MTFEDLLPFLREIALQSSFGSFFLDLSFLPLMKQKHEQQGNCNKNFISSVSSMTSISTQYDNYRGLKPWCFCPFELLYFDSFPSPFR